MKILRYLLILVAAAGGIRTFPNSLWNPFTLVFLGFMGLLWFVRGLGKPKGAPGPQAGPFGEAVMPRASKSLGALLAFLPLCVAAGTAQVHTTGNELLQWLTGTSYEQEKGSYYLDGVVDGITIAGVASRKPVVCLPSGVNLGQISDVVAKGLRNDPEDRHLAASILVFLTLKETWPCKPSK